jgi:N-acetylneuraminic acid mutarotase
MKRSTIFLVISLFTLFIFISCGGGGGGSDSGDGAPNIWTWMSGSNTVNQPGFYWTLGSPGCSDVPGARVYSVSWIDNSDNLWLFGGLGYAVTGSIGQLNDLLRFDGTNWTWMSGSNQANQPGIYSSAPLYVPGARNGAVSWTVNADNLRLFGGYGWDATGSRGFLNDMWRFDGTNWSWMSGGNTINQPGYYGTLGSPGISNVPGARTEAVSWTDSADNLWLFGGSGYADTTGSTGYLNDLWRFDGTTWTWMFGSNTVNQPGYYGTQGSPGGSNVPGARQDGLSWTDNSGNLWLFGGYGYADTTGITGLLNDLWMYDGTTWTWISGNNTVNHFGIYGTMGSPASTNAPGGRSGSLSWTDNSGNLWLFGGSGYSTPGNTGFLNDLWRYSP